MIIDYRIIAIVCIALVGATVIAPFNIPLMSRLSLAAENNVASWWSSMLLLLACLYAFDRCKHLKPTSTDASRGWLMLSAILLVLSFDEVGSLHERLSSLGRILSVGSWGLLIPLGSVGAILTAWAIALLWREPSERWRARWVALGFCLFGSVVAQEFLEHKMLLETAAQRGVRAGLEEGTELLGVLIILRAVMTGATEHAFRALRELRAPLLTAGLLLGPVVAVGTAMLTDHHRGQPADWPAAAAFFAVSLIYLQDRAWGLSILYCMASALVVEVSLGRPTFIGQVSAYVFVQYLALAVYFFATWQAGIFR